MEGRSVIQRSITNEVCTIIQIKVNVRAKGFRKFSEAKGAILGTPYSGAERDVGKLCNLLSWNGLFPTKSGETVVRWETQSDRSFAHARDTGEC
jgi:hypothetical protein